MKNKYIFIIAFTIIFYNNIFAQNRTAEKDQRVYEIIAQDVCKMYENLKVKLDMAKYENRFQLDSCMSIVLLKYRESLDIPHTVSPILTPENAQNLNNIYGTPTFVFLIKNCAVFGKQLYESMWEESNKSAKAFKEYQERPREEEAKKEEVKMDTMIIEEHTEMPDSTMAYEEAIPRLLVKGKVEKLETKNYTFLVIKNENGKEERFIWLRNFGYDIAEDLARNFKKYKGKSITVEYGETEVFDTKSKKFVNYREIYSINWE